MEIKKLVAEDGEKFNLVQEADPQDRLARIPTTSFRFSRDHPCYFTKLECRLEIVVYDSSVCAMVDVRGPEGDHFYTLRFGKVMDTSELSPDLVIRAVDLFATRYTYKLGAELVRRWVNGAKFSIDFTDKVNCEALLQINGDGFQAFQEDVAFLIEVLEKKIACPA